MIPCEEDLRLIGGEFITADLPHDKAWLARYFRSELLYRFVVYYVTFRNLTKRVSLRYYCQLFIDHTGWHCSIQLLCRTAARIKKLEAAVAKAEQDRDLATLTELKLGSYIFQ